jgi:hypothetical protein
VSHLSPNPKTSRKNPSIFSIRISPVTTQSHVISRPKVEKSLLSDNNRSGGWPKFKPITWSSKVPLQRFLPLVEMTCLSSSQSLSRLAVRKPLSFSQNRR